LDAGGVLVLPDRERLARAAAGAGVMIDPGLVPRAHYRAVRAFDRAVASGRLELRRSGEAYMGALSAELGVDRDALAGAMRWRELTPGAPAVIDALRAAGLAVVVVTNSDGHGAENLRACGIDTVPVIDSTPVGFEKPDPRIFSAALELAGGVEPDAVVHVGDTLCTDIDGARAAGITPIHFDPLRGCRAGDHRHIRVLAGVWRHVLAG
jgi:putative hydrolase of the HAD superfamily